LQQERQQGQQQGQQQPSSPAGGQQDEEAEEEAKARAQEALDFVEQLLEAYFMQARTFATSMPPKAQSK